MSTRQKDRTDSAQRLQLLYRISLEFSGTLDLDDTLGKALSLTVNALDASNGSIFLLDSHGRVTRNILARPNLAPEDSRQVVNMVMEAGLAGWVARNRAPAVIVDTLKDERWVNFPNDITSPRSALCVPLMRGQRIAGLLTLIHPLPDHFSDQDVELASTIAGLAAVAVENARLFTQANVERRTLAAVLRHVRAAILVTDTNQNILFINPPAAAIFGVSVEQAGGESTRTIGGESSGRDIRTIAGKSLDTIIENPALLELFDQSDPNMETPISGEVTINGSTFNVVLSPVPGVGYATVLHDITFLKRLDELKTESLEVISHDLRGPLDIILGSAEMMAEYTDVGEEQKELVSLITRTAGRMHSLVERLLDLSRLESGREMEWKVVSLQEALEKILHPAWAQAQLKKVHLEAEFAPNLPLLRIDPVRLGQAVSNLLDNAIKFTPAGGRVTLSVTLDNDRSAMLIRVSDTGPGIPPKAIDKVFTKFFRVGSMQTIEREGTGLGLTIVRSAVKAHGGRVWAESNGVPGQGVTFTVSIPLDNALGDDSI